MNGFEENEISINAYGGTELAKRKLASILDADLLDNFQIICSRPRDLDPNKIRIFWCHDLPEDPESAKFRDKKFLSKFHKIVYISNWQYSRYQLVHGIPYDQSGTVIEHGFDPAPDTCIQKPDGDIRIVYTSTPQRGLELLVPVFEKLSEAHPECVLDVYSSFKIYGWDSSDQQFEPLYDKIRNHPRMNYHGFVQHDELQKNLQEAHIFAYPSIWLETACRAMIEAMSAGLVCVHPNYGALSDTSGGLNVMYHGSFNDKVKHANVFASNLNAAIELVKSGKQQQMTTFNKIFADSRYNITKIKNQWNGLLTGLLNEYPTEESRKFQPDMFVYNTEST